MGMRWAFAGISAEILKSIPWRALQKIRKAFEMRYLAQNSEEVETWLRNTIVLISKKKTMNRLEDREEESMCRVCWPNGIVDGRFILLETELGEVEKRDKSWGDVRIFGFIEGRSAIEISTAIRPMAAVAREWVLNLDSLRAPWM